LHGFLLDSFERGGLTNAMMITISMQRKPDKIIAKRPLNRFEKKPSCNALKMFYRAGYAKLFAL
jgi:hypothetical protein